MTPPTFWRRSSQRTPSTSQGPTDRDGLTITPNGASTPRRDQSQASSNATIRLPVEAEEPNEESQLLEQDAGRWNQYIRRHFPAKAAQREPRSTLYLVILTLSLMGAQLAWCLELSYGTPYLLSLGLSPAQTSLVWLAGPLSGLIAQPIVGALSDRSDSAYRRRAYILGSSIFITASTLALAFAQPVSEAIVDFLNLGLADWDPVRKDWVDTATKLLAVASFWVLDFALNGLQAGGRALVLDSLDGSEMDKGNAWLGRMTHIGNIVGYSAGYLDLSRLSFLAFLGGDQFRKFAIIALVGLLISVTITCFLVTEATQETSTFSSSSNVGKASKPSAISQLRYMVTDIWAAIKTLPRPIRRVCLVQLFAFCGWFPFLFYSTTWIGTFEPRGSSSHQRENRERKGTRGMLLFACVSLFFGTLIPLISLSDFSSSPIKAKLRGGVLRLLPPYGSQPRHKGLPLRSIWGIACILYSVLAFFTFFVRTTTQATILIGLIGIPWSVNAWVPFALVMGFVKETSHGRSEMNGAGDVEDDSTGRRQLRSALGDCEPLGRPISANPAASGQTRISSGSYIARGSEVIREQTPTATSTVSNEDGANSTNPTKSRRRSSFLDQSVESIRVHDAEDDAEHDEDNDGAPLLGAIDRAAGRDDDAEDDQGSSQQGGTILGIHNLSIVLPQLFVSLVSSLIFSHFTDSSSADSQEGDAPGVVWVLRFGGFAMIGAAVLTRLVPLLEGERLLAGDVDDDDDDDDGGSQATIGRSGH